jgi:hypothetical protein
MDEIRTGWFAIRSIRGADKKGVLNIEGIDTEKRKVLLRQGKMTVSEKITFLDTNLDCSLGNSITRLPSEATSQENRPGVHSDVFMPNQTPGALNQYAKGLIPAPSNPGRYAR